MIEASLCDAYARTLEWRLAWDRYIALEDVVSNVDAHEQPGVNVTGDTPVGCAQPMLSQTAGATP